MSDQPRHCAGCGGWVSHGPNDEGHECFGLAEAGRSADSLDALLPWIASQYEVHGRTEWHLLNCIYRKTWPMGGEDEPGCIALRAALSTDRSASPTVHCEGDAGDAACGDIRPHLPHDIFAPTDRSAEG